MDTGSCHHGALDSRSRPQGLEVICQGRSATGDVKDSSNDWSYQILLATIMYIINIYFIYIYIWHALLCLQASMCHKRRSPEWMAILKAANSQDQRKKRRLSAKSHRHPPPMWREGGWTWAVGVAAISNLLSLCQTRHGLKWHALLCLQASMCHKRRSPEWMAILKAANSQDQRKKRRPSAKSHRHPNLHEKSQISVHSPLALPNSSL